MKGKLGALVAAAFLFGAPAVAGAISINFDTGPTGTALTDGTVIDTLYSSLGVTFAGIDCTSGSCVSSSVYARTGFAASAPNVVSFVAPPVIAPFGGTLGAVEAIFSLGMGTVSIDAAPFVSPENLSAVNNQPYLSAWALDGTFLGTSYYPIALNGTSTPPLGWGTYQTISFTSALGNIGRVRFSTQASQGGANVYSSFDNLSFAGQTGGNPPVSAPEPSSLVLLGLGLVGTFATGRLRLS